MHHDLSLDSPVLASTRIVRVHPGVVMEDIADLAAGLAQECVRLGEALLAAQAEILRLQSVVASVHASSVALKARAGGNRVTGAAPEPPAPEVDEAKEPRFPRLRSPVAQIIVDALEEAGDEGLSGRALNQIVAEKGYQKDTSEKAKAALKRAKRVRHDWVALHWYALGRGPKRIPGEK